MKLAVAGSSRSVGRQSVPPELAGVAYQLRQRTSPLKTTFR